MKRVLLILLMFTPLTFAGVEYREFKNPEQEQAYNGLIAELRCLVCQNQNIADSNADLAKDLRRQVYEMLHQGKSRQEIADFMIDRYGDFVMYKPRFNSKTLVLWLGPVVFIVIGLGVIFLIIRNKQKQAIAAPLAAEQQAKITALLDDEDTDS